MASVCRNASDHSQIAVISVWQPVIQIDLVEFVGGLVRWHAVIRVVTCYAESRAFHVHKKTARPPAPIASGMYLRHYPGFSCSILLIWLQFVTLCRTMRLDSVLKAVRKKPGMRTSM